MLHNTNTTHFLCFGLDVGQGNLHYFVSTIEIILKIVICDVPLYVLTYGEERCCAFREVWAIG